MRYTVHKVPEWLISIYICTYIHNWERYVYTYLRDRFSSIYGCTAINMYVSPGNQRSEFTFAKYIPIKLCNMYIRIQGG